MTEIKYYGDILFGKQTREKAIYNVMLIAKAASIQNPSLVVFGCSSRRGSQRKSALNQSSCISTLVGDEFKHGLERHGRPATLIFLT